MASDAGRRVTVFGASGFIGRYVVKRLTARGFVVRAAVRDPIAAAFLKPMGVVGQVVPLRADITDAAAVAEAVAGAEIVINLVGILHESGRQRFDAVQAQAPELAAAAAKRAGVGQFIQISAIGADAASPSHYARSKAAGEAGARRNFPAAVVLRPSIVFGPEDDFFNRFAGMARFMPFLPLIGGGRTRFQPVYVGDVAEAILRVIDNPSAAGKTYELGGPQIASFKELMQMMFAETGRPRALIDVPFAIARLKASILEKLPAPLLTRDQVAMLERDNVASPELPGLAELGIEPTAMAAILPRYLEIFRRGGRYSSSRFA
jgi:NADH dehydrogenase